MAHELTTATGEPTDLMGRLAAAESSVGLALNPDWTIAEPLPAEYRDRIPTALATMQAACQPASPKHFAVCMHDLIEWIEVFGVVPLPADPAAREDRIAQIVARYQADLSDLPADLLRDAIRHVTGSAKYRVLPMPGDVRAVVADEMERRRHAVRRLETARRVGKFEDEPLRVEPSPEDKAKVTEMVAQAARSLEGGVKVPDWTKTDPRERDPSPLAEQYRQAHQAVASAPRRAIPRPWAGDGSDAA